MGKVRPRALLSTAPDDYKLCLLTGTFPRQGLLWPSFA